MLAARFFALMFRMAVLAGTPPHAAAHIAARLDRTALDAFIAPHYFLDGFLRLLVGLWFLARLRLWLVQRALSQRCGDRRRRLSLNGCRRCDGRRFGYRF